MTLYFQRNLINRTGPLNNLILFRGLLALLLFGCTYSIYRIDNKNPLFNILSRTNMLRETDWPVIRSWTPFFSEPLVELLLSSYNRTKCEYKCRFLDKYNQTFSTTTDAYVFHSRNINLKDLPINRTSDQLFILFGMESAYHFGNTHLKLPSDYFNATSTYRMDSDYPFPYFNYEPLEENEIPMWTQSEIVQRLKNKSGIAVINSNCATHSKRELYITELSKHINITKKGRCYNNSIVNCPRFGSSKECRDKFLSQFKFYLSFENSVCQDYATEKFSYQSQMIIPIVLRRSSVETLLPKGENMFIAADDFKTPKKLAEYLNFLENNNTEYLKHFDWTKRYRLNFEMGGTSMCKLCEDIYKIKVNRLMERTATKFNIDNANCYDNYAKELLNKK